MWDLHPCALQLPPKRPLVEQFWALDRSRDPRTASCLDCNGYMLHLQRIRPKEKIVFFQKSELLQRGFEQVKRRVCGVIIIMMRMRGFVILSVLYAACGWKCWVSYINMLWVQGCIVRKRIQNEVASYYISFNWMFPYYWWAAVASRFGKSSSMLKSVSIAVLIV